MPHVKDVESLRARRGQNSRAKDVSFVSIDDGYETDLPQSESSTLSDAPKTPSNVFSAAEALDLYRPVEGFEGAHRFDPSATWSPEEEKKLVKKVRTFIAVAQESL